uniref:C3 Protein n=1 Tax=Prunus geminivirus A TaxID=2022321 RepID=A0A2L1GUT7_9GEMI|nr:C3 Protein [Prunus geminivirus A]
MESHTYTPCSSSGKGSAFVIQNTLTSPYRLIPITQTSQNQETSKTFTNTSPRMETTSSSEKNQPSTLEQDLERWILENTSKSPTPEKNSSTSSKPTTHTSTSSIYNDLNTLLTKHGLQCLPPMSENGQLGITFHQKFSSGPTQNSSWYVKIQPEMSSQ